MSEKEYSVSETVRLVGVESHVLRYWEDELQVKVRRNGQGHRIYSEENIALFCRTRDLREKGLQLKAIRLMLEEQKKHPDGSGTAEAGEVEAGRTETELTRQVRALLENAGSDRISGPMPENRGEKAEEELQYEIVVTEENRLSQFERILRHLMEEVVSEQNEKLTQAMSGLIREELEDFCLQYAGILGEAAASSEQQAEKAEQTENRKGKFRKRLEKFLRRN